MAAGHQHAGHVPRAGEAYRGRLWAVAALLGAVMLAEVVAAVISGSLALLSDAGHMFTDVLGIGMALAAMTAASRSAQGGQRTYGLYRLEVLAALGNAVLLSGVAVYVLVEAVHRLFNPPEVQVGPMFVVAGLALLANLVAFGPLRSGARESINLRGAYIEVLGDVLGSIGVLAAAAVITLTGWRYADPIVAVAIGLFILPRTWRLGRAAVHILVQAAPERLDVASVRARLADVPGVHDVHDLHVWTLTSGMDVASAHLMLDPDAEMGTVLATARQTLRDQFQIDHATLQVEPADGRGACQPVGW